jgi:hypothetical protein
MNLTIEQWIAREFEPDSRPPIATVRRWIREGKVPATKMGRRLYINLGITLDDTMQNLTHRL